MSNDSVILNQIRKDWYNQGSNLINVHIYVKEVDDLDIVFDETSVTLSFYTRQPKFLKEHGVNKKHNKRFIYVLNTRYEIDTKDSKYHVKEPYIELLIKKTIEKKWESLECQPSIQTKKKHDDTPSPSKKQPSKGQKKGQQLLGGKSTPLSKKGNESETKQETETKVDTNLPGSSNASAVDKRNIQKTVSQSQVESNLGLTGLENYANNCYMNVVIQLLANIQELRDYLKSDQYIKDINTNNPLCSGGKVVKAFADVVKILWSYRRNAFKPSELKSIMGKRCTLFLGWQQHDAQEFCSSLLDNLHEDLNQPRGGEPNEGSENEKPETAWNSHTKRNNSFIVKMFHGQLMSKVTCDSCRKVSYSYDPCAQISLPIPSSKQTLQVVFFTRDIASPPMLIKLQVSTSNAKLWHLVNMLQTTVKVPHHLIALFSGVTDVCFNLQSSLTPFAKQKFIVAAELSAKDENDVISVPVFQHLSHARNVMRCDNCLKTQDEIQGKLKRCTRCMVASYCSRDCQTKHWSFHSKVCTKELKSIVGLSFFVTVKKDTTYERLEEVLRERAKFTTEAIQVNATEPAESNSEQNSENKGNESAENKIKPTQTSSNLKFLIKASSKMNVNNEESATELDPETFTTEQISKSACLIMEWQNSVECDEKNGEEISTRKMPIHEEIGAECFGVTSPQDQCSLYDSLKLFMEPERLDERESWKCPKCATPQSAKKEMAISSPPLLLLLHLKRFTYGDHGQKIHRAVSYPLNGLDLTPYVAKETRNKMDHSLVYDLCGVITHRGNMRMGHYTCMVRLINQLDQEEVGWRYFDDDSVMKIKSEKVVSQDAYVLMYRVRGAHNAVRLDRFTSLSNVSGSQENSSSSSSSVTKRKHAIDSTSSKQDRKNASEYTLGVNMKRSLSVENPSDGRKGSDSDNNYSSPVSTRRCTSAIPNDNSTRKKEYATQSSNLTSTSLPNVALAANNVTLETSKLASGSSEGSLEENFDTLTLNDNDENAKDDTVFESTATTKNDVIEPGTLKNDVIDKNDVTESIVDKDDVILGTCAVDVASLNENDLD